MPIYEYRCSSCGEIFEQMRKMDDPWVEKAIHPECCSCLRMPEAVRVPSVARAKFTGSGFYETDYKTKS